MMNDDDDSNDSPPPSEVIWWGDEDKQGDDSLEQKEEVVSKLVEDGVSNSTKETPTLTGEVRTFHSTEEEDLFQAGDEAKAPGISKTAWFFIGLILAPCILGFVSFILAVIGESLLDENWFNDWDDSTTREDSVSINQVVHNVYSADLSNANSDLNKYSELYVWYNWESYATDSYGGCNFNYWQGETGIEVVEDSGGNYWMAMECWWSEDENLEAFLKMEDGGVLLATQKSEDPVSAGLDGSFGGGNELGDVFLFLSFIIWPIGIIGGLIWGFVSGNSSFAWGMLSSVVVVPLIFLGLCAIFIIVFFGGGF